MKRLPRILLNVGTVLSLVLCVATVVLWVRSYRYADVYAAQPAYNRQYVIGTSRGLLLLVRLAADPPDGKTFSFRQSAGWSSREDDGTQKSAPSGGVLGFRWRSDNGDYASLRSLVMPLWFVGLLTAVMPAAHAFRRRKFRRGLCPACGYDLRATPERCPECGHVREGAVA